MHLKPIIASYRAESTRAIRQFLTPDVLDAIARVALAPVDPAAIDLRITAELVEMHVLTGPQGPVRLATTVFREADIQRVHTACAQWSADLIRCVTPAAAGMRGEPPAILNFLVGIVGIGQYLHQSLKQSRVVVDWKNYGGRYAQSKVDFDEICPAAEQLGPDLQNKAIQRSAAWTAVAIGPDLGKMSPETPDALVTEDIFQKHLPAVLRIGQIAEDWYFAHLPAMRSLLESTTSGSQGVPAENMMMHFWRSMRRSIAQGFYEQGLFTDAVPRTGCITVCFENRIAQLAEWFC